MVIRTLDLLLPHNFGITQLGFCLLISVFGIAAFLQRYDIQLVVSPVVVGGCFYAKSAHRFGRILLIFCSRQITLISAGHYSDSGVILLLVKNDTAEDVRMDEGEALVRVKVSTWTCRSGFRANRRMPWLGSVSIPSKATNIFRLVTPHTLHYVRVLASVLSFDVCRVLLLELTIYRRYMTIRCRGQLCRDFRIRYANPVCDPDIRYKSRRLG